MKILIVDDEIMIRVGLKSAIAWEANGFEIVGDACNGEEALKIFNERHPDIVLTDIKMPVMDGLQLVEKIKEIDKSVKIIILSCYNEFDFVKRALRLGAEDYLLKAEFNQQELLEKVIKLRDDLLFLKEEKKLIRDVKYLNTYTNRNNLMKDLIWGLKPQRNDVIEKLKLFGVNINFNSYMLIVLKIENTDVISLKWEDNKDGLFSAALINIVEEIMNSYKSGFIFESNEEFIIILNMWEKSELKVHENVVEICQKIKSSVLMYLNVGATLGVSSVHYDPANMKTAYNEAQSAMKRRFFLGKDVTIFYTSDTTLSNSNEGNVKEIIFRENQLHTAVETLDKKIIEKVLFDFFASLLQFDQWNTENIYDKVIEFLYLFKKSISSIGYDMNDVLNEKFNPVNIIKSNSTFDELAEEVRKIVFKTIDAIIKKQCFPICRPVQRAIEYIDRHYNENISLLAVAAYLGLNMSYLSNLFKSETGENFTEYLTKIRMNEAKKLLNQKKYKIYEIAQMVGYPNESYFSTIFKKTLGFNPRDYYIDR